MVKQISTQNRGDWQRLTVIVTDIHTPEGHEAMASTQADAAEGELLILTGMLIPEQVEAGEFYTIRFQFEGDGGRATRVCFPAAGAQATCWDRFTLNKNTQTIETSSRIGTPGTYTVTGFVEYQDGGKTLKTNQVSAPVRVE